MVREIWGCRRELISPSYSLTAHSRLWRMLRLMVPSSACRKIQLPSSEIVIVTCYTFKCLTRKFAGMRKSFGKKGQPLNNVWLACKPFNHTATNDVKLTQVLDWFLNLNHLYLLISDFTNMHRILWVKNISVDVNSPITFNVFLTD